MRIINYEEQFKNYIKEYGKLIFSICYSITRDYFESEDLAQETFLSAYRNYHNFDGGNVKAWLTKIAANKCCDYLKKASRREEAAEDNYLENIIDTRASPEEEFMGKDIDDKLLEICQKLKDPYKTVAIKHFYNGLSISQISIDERQNYKTLQTRIYRARSMLKRLWKEEYL